MNFTWEKRNSNVNSLEELMTQRKGIDYEIPNYLDLPTSELPFIENLDEAAHLIVDYMQNNKRWYVVSDYDCDGVCSAVIMRSIVSFKEGYKYSSPVENIPDRFTEGYGVSQRRIASMPNKSLLVLLDNGISKEQEIAYAKLKDMKVIVVDHHLAPPVLPNADVIINPKIDNASEFKEYCTGGLAMRLALRCAELLGYSEEEIAQVRRTWTFYAALATVADMVPLTYENRLIVQNGLANIPEDCINIPRLLLGKPLETRSITAEDVGYYIGPCINSCGRIRGNGGIDALQRLFCGTFVDPDRMEASMKHLLKINEQRKSITKKVRKAADVIIEQNKLYESPIMIVRLRNANQGVLGIVASGIMEKYKKPVIVLTDVHRFNLTGSGRAPEGFNLKDALDAVSGTLTKYGGHAAAAGLTLRAEDYDDFISKLTDHAKGITFDTNNYYDLPLDSMGDWEDIITKMEQYEPFGMGNETPVFKITMKLLPGKAGHKVMGTDKSHLRLCGFKYDATAFSLADKYKELGSPETVTLYGIPRKNTINEQTKIEFMAVDIQAADSPEVDDEIQLTDLGAAMFNSLS